LTGGLRSSTKYLGAPEDVRDYISGKIRGLLNTGQFLDAIPDYLLPDEASQGRLKILINRLTQIAKISKPGND